jgi:hypothetical protein
MRSPGSWPAASTSLIEDLMREHLDPVEATRARDALGAIAARSGTAQ